MDETVIPITGISLPTKACKLLCAGIELACNNIIINIRLSNEMDHVVQMPGNFGASMEGRYPIMDFAFSIACLPGSPLMFAFHFQYMRDRGGSEHSFSDAADAHHGAVGPQSLHPHSAAAAGHASATLRPRQAQVKMHTSLRSLKLSPFSSRPNLAYHYNCKPN